MNLNTKVVDFSSNEIINLHLDCMPLYHIENQMLLDKKSIKFTKLPIRCIWFPSLKRHKKFGDKSHKTILE